MRLRQSWKPRDWLRWLSAARRTVWLGGGTERFRSNTSFQPSTVLGASSVLTMVLGKVTQGCKCSEVERQPGCCGPVEAAALSRRHVEFRLNHSGGGETERTSSNLAISPNIDRKLYSGRLNFNITSLRLVKWWVMNFWASTTNLKFTPGVLNLQPRPLVCSTGLRQLLWQCSRGEESLWH